MTDENTAPVDGMAAGEVAAGTPAASPAAAGAEHPEHEDYGWTVQIPDHPARTESHGFVASKAVAKKIAAQAAGVGFWGNGAIQMHHGGSLYLKDDTGWFIVKNSAGMEWSSQFCADPAKVDLLRMNAQRLYAAFPKTVPAMIALGYKDAESILNTAITEANGVATWVDSIYNSCVPIPDVRHTGVLPKGGGVHHYPTPITDIELIKHDDFVLWVTDAQGQPAAVVPTGARGSGDGGVQVVYATPNTELHSQVLAAHDAGTTVQLPAEDPLAQAAFKNQTSGPSARKLSSS